MTQPAALIFDVDGTLAETEEVHRLAFNATFAAFGLPWVWERPLYRALLDVSGGKERIAHFIATHDPPGGRDADIRRLHAVKTERYTAMVAEGAARLRPGIARLIADAQAADVTLAIATTTSLPNVAALLRATLGAASLDAFAVIGAGDIVPAKKPAPDIYHYVLDRLRLPPAACVAFEDSANGLAAARGAELATVVTPGLYTDDQDFSGALAVLSDLDAPMVTLPVLTNWLAAASGARSD